MTLSHFAGQFWTLSVWSLESLFFLPPFLIIFVSASLSLAIAFLKQRPFRNPLWRGSHWLALTQLLFFPVVISIGVLYPASGPSFLRTSPNSIASTTAGILGWLSLALAGFWVYRMKGFRWFAFSLVAVLQMILMGAFFVAGMAVSGDWL